jgi:ubiquinone/menaquinone biosynthesis C-methylase UbiE
VPQGRCRHAIGLDLSAGMLRSLADLRESGGLSLVQADAQCLPLPDESVDVAMAMHMLYHVPDIPAAIRELRRITKPGGTVLASTNGSAHLAEIHDLLVAAVSSQLDREPTLAWIGEPLDFDAVLDDIAMKVEQAIQAQGSFRATSHMGVFVCR